MKSLLALTFSLFVIFSAFGKPVDDGGGWSSSGGGEYIISLNNPWFMGTQPAKWCIDHGGADKFSLSPALAKIQIENAISTLTTQLKNINEDHTNKEDISNIIEYHHERTCGMGKKANGEWIEDCNVDSIRITDKYIYTVNCEEADIEFILGNTNNEKIKKLISNVGLEKFKKIAGITIRTDYSQETLRGKGFIYIAADRGEIQYEGERSINIKSDSIWDLVDKLPANTPFPKNVADNYNFGLSQKLKLKDHAIGALIPVVAHEFGHILGLSHNQNKNLMDEDYPADTIRTGLSFKGNFAQDSMIFTRALLEVKSDRRMGFERIIDQMELKYFAHSKKAQPNIHEFLYENFENTNGSEVPLVNFMVFDLSNEYLSKVRFLTLDQNTTKYKLLKEVQIKMSKTCFEPVLVETVSLRYNLILEDIINWVFDPNKEEWIQSKISNHSRPVTNHLLRFENVRFCGKIDAYPYDLDFEIRHNYYQGHDELILRDSVKKYQRAIKFNSNHISTLSIDEKLPSNLQPVFFFWGDSTDR